MACNEPVSTTQSEGRRVLIVVPTPKDLAPQLRRRADEVMVIEPSALRTFFRPSIAEKALVSAGPSQKRRR